MRALFVSDVHLDSVEEPRGEKFLKFLKGIKGGSISHLFFVGDIFDLWIADHDYFLNRHNAVVNEVKRLKQEGVEIHYFEGNHDLYLEHFWQNKLGVVVHKGPAYFNLGGYTVRVEHGDEFNPQDHGYKFLRWFLRTPVMKAFGRFAPGSLITRIGETASHQSRNYTSGTIDDRVRDILRRYVREKFNEKPFDVMISGHVHVLDIETFAVDGRFVRSFNLGSWLAKPCYLAFSEKAADVVLL